MVTAADCSAAVQPASLIQTRSSAVASKKLK